MAKRAWYRFTAAQADAPGVADLYIFGSIGRSWWDDDAVGAKQFVDALNALPDSVTTLRIHVSSLGGDYWDGLTIANTLRGQSQQKGRRVEVSIEGVAASAATLVTSAGDVIRIAENARVMVHHPIGLTWDTAKVHRKNAELLDALSTDIVATYRWHSTLEPGELVALMDEETWLSADEAIEKGFATEKAQAMQVAACIDPRAMVSLKVPDHAREMVDALTIRPASHRDPVTADPKAVIHACTAAGFPDLAEDLLGQPMDAVTARLQQAKEIRSLCATAKLPELAEGYLRARTPADVVRAHLTTITAKLDARTEINGHLAPDERAPKRTDLTPAAIYAGRNKLAITKGERT